MPVSVEIAIVLGLIILNGFFAMAEMALISSRRARLQELVTRRVRGAALAIRLAENPGSFLSTVQIGITLIGVLAGAISGATLAEQLGARLDAIAFVQPHGRVVAMVVVVALITYGSLIVGELVPKQIALTNAERIAALVAPVMTVIARVARPLVAVLQGSTRVVLAAMHLSSKPRETVSESEVRALLREGAEAGVFAPTEHGMVSEVMRLDARPVTTIMTPRLEVVWLKADATREDVARTLASTNHSRFPVCEGDFESVIGIVSAKRLLEQLLRGDPLDIRAVMREPIIVPKSSRVLEVLQILKSRRPHMAVVVDEYATIQGIVTPSDVLETIAGDFADGGSVSPSIVRRPDGTWLVDGQTELVELDEQIGTTLSIEDPYRSLAAHLLREFKRLPAEGDTVDRGEWRFEVVDMDGRRIDKVLLRRLREDPASDRAA